MAIQLRYSVRLLSLYCCYASAIFIASYGCTSTE